MNSLIPTDPEEEAPDIRGTYLDFSRYPEKINPRMKKILKRKKPNRFKWYLALHTDVIIIDLFYGDIKKDMKFLVNALKSMKEEQLAEKPKTFIVISNVMTWADSDPIKTEKV